MQDFSALQVVSGFVTVRLAGSSQECCRYSAAGVVDNHVVVMLVIAAYMHSETLVLVVGR